MQTSFDPMQRFSEQEVLFAPRPKRLALQSVLADSRNCRRISINVWRNHAFEPIEPLVRPFARFGRWDPIFTIGGYDDSLSFAGHQPADIELIWLDPDRLPPDSLSTGWMAARASALRSLSAAPIVLATWSRDADDAAGLQQVVDALPATYFADLRLVAEAAKTPLHDKRSALVAGTPLAGELHALIARELACHWLAATVLAPIKAVALDLDNTLHQGVLGEEGVDGVLLTPGHSALQHHAAQLSKRGIFVALVSRNERPDVEELFAKRSDYPLRWDDFSATEISWDSKADAVARIAKALRIGSDAVLFVDDNIGELSTVALQTPAVHTLHAHEDPDLTLRAIEYYPGLWRWKTEAEDAKRVLDMRANAQREMLATAHTDPADYFRSLQVALVFQHDPTDHLGRLADLCRKTNQFNLALRRYTEAEVAEKLAAPRSCVASVQLRDRLSDSGIIAVIVGDRVGPTLVVEELCISCRAMGRNLEDSIVLNAIRTMPVFEGAESVAFRVKHAPRNQPALQWLARLLAMTGTPEEGLHTLDANHLREFTPATGVEHQFI